MIAWDVLDEPVERRYPRTSCDLCGAELDGEYHPAVLLITHHTWRHAATLHARRAA